MNGTQQRTHRTVTGPLDERVSTLEAIVQQLKSLQTTLAILEDRAKLAHDLAVAAHNSLAEFCGRPFLGRLRWLVTGR